MFNNIAFIGGIHGVGKSTICQHICNKLSMEYLSASQLLKWNSLNQDVKSKKVKDISETQNRLILGLNNSIKTEKNYMLDGHYCLLNTNNEIINIPLEIFKQINPFSLNIILDDVSAIKERLETRDNRIYDYKILESFQGQELKHAKFLSKTLGITLNIGAPNDYSEMLTSLHNLKSKINR